MSLRAPASGMPSRTSVLWSPEAEEDVLDIWSYFAREASPAIADKQLRELLERIDSLREWPHAGRSRDELRPGIRSMATEPHIIFYQLSQDGIEIVRVLHGRRDIDSIFGGVG